MIFLNLKKRTNPGEGSVKEFGVYMVYVFLPVPVGGRKLSCHGATNYIRVPVMKTKLLVTVHFINGEQKTMLISVDVFGF
jgi:hypothetical protein